MIIMKFGGVSVGDGTMLAKVADIAKREPKEKVLVVSAMAGVTDSLLDAVGRIKQDETLIDPFIETLRQRHEQALDVAVVGEEEAARVQAELDSLLQRLERLLYGIAYTEELTGKTRDLAVTYGERFTTRVLASVLRSRGVPAEPLDADDAGVVTDGVFGNATPLMDEVAENLATTIGPMLKRGITPVMTGFFGRDHQGHVTTFGRGGSDYSAAIVASALDAERLEVWKDVKGFLTADPRVLPEAQPLPEMTYDEAAELAYVGAKVLHPRTVEPLEAKGIAIHVRNTEAPELAGTRISNDLKDAIPRMRSVAVRGNLAIIRLYGPGMAYTSGIGKRVFTRLGDAKINVYNMAASQASFALLVNGKDVDAGVEVLENAYPGIIQRVEPIREMSLVCAVGHAIGTTPGMAGRIFNVVGEAGVNVEMISVGASDIALNFVVSSAQSAACVRAIHNEFLAPGLIAGDDVAGAGPATAAARPKPTPEGNE